MKPLPLPMNTAPRYPHGFVSSDILLGPDPEGMIAGSEFTPLMQSITYHHEVVEEAINKARRRHQWLLVFVLGTKPCYYKFWGSIDAAKVADLPHVIVDTGQHYDTVLTHGAREFGFEKEIAVQFHIRGDLSQKAGELFWKTRWLALHVAKRAPDITVVPVVLGDTLMTAVVPMAWLFTRQSKSIQLEAGLRSMTPMVLQKLAKDNTLSLDTFFQAQQQGAWERVTEEPYPEQFDTFVSAAASRFLFCPLAIHRSHLIQEGHAPEDIFEIGGMIGDAFQRQRTQKPIQSIFQKYPVLRRHRWLRVDIHRKENTTPRRLQAIIGAVSRLVKRGHYVNFVGMNATQQAVEQQGLSRDLNGLKRYKNFLYTPVWPEYANVLEFYQSPSCLAALTDSGGLQEELNLLQVPCLTCRFSTDRPETVQNHTGNLLVPPVSPEFLSRAVEHLVKSAAMLQRMRSGKKLYEQKAGHRFIQKVLHLMKLRERLFQWTHEKLGFWKESSAGGPFFSP